jgi:hypothetical protein
MRSHSCIACSALVVFLLACGASVADRIDLDTARAIAAQHADSPLSDREPYVHETPDGLSLATFWVIENEEIMAAYTVDLDQGCLFSWRIDVEAVFDPTADPITYEEAVERAKEIAERHLGEAARGMGWQVGIYPRDWVVVEGQSPLSGDPPRTGLGHWCKVRFRGPGGVVADYFQRLPDSTDELEVRVSREQAIEAARKEIKPRNLPLLGEPSLDQFRGTVRWLLHFGSSRGRLVDAIVDAQSGEVLEVSPVEVRRAAPKLVVLTVEPPVQGAVAPVVAPFVQAPASPVAADEPDSTCPPWVLYGGIVLLCAIALGLFLLRRRRN